MSGVSTHPNEPLSGSPAKEHRSLPWRSFAGVLGLYALGSWYLHSSIPLDGDGAAYALQAAGDVPLERSVHAGYLLPLWLVVTTLHWPPEVLSVLAGGLALLVAMLLGRQLLVTVPRDGRLPPGGARDHAVLLAPLSLLAAQATWKSTGTVEIHALLGLLVLASTWALSTRRGVLAGVLLAWAGATQPAAWVLVPGLLLISGADRRSAATACGLGLVLHAGVLALLWPEWWSGGRGLLQSAALDRSPWESLQAAWRLLARGMGPAALALLAGLLVAPRRRAVGLGIAAAGAALLLDRHSDNPGQLPTLWLGCCFAPLTLRWIESLVDERLARLSSAGVVLLLALGIAEATTRHDADVRGAERDAEVLLQGGCSQPGLDWADSIRLELLCSQSEPPAR